MEEFKETVTIHGFNQKPPSTLYDVFVAYHVGDKGWAVYGLWTDHPKLKAVLDLIGSKERSSRSYTTYPAMSQEDFKDLVDMDKLVENHVDLRKPAKRGWL
ncbi:hypothetical protein D3C87_1197270 [compost metagenome]